MVELKKQSPQTFSSTDMCTKWPIETIQFLEKLIKYVPNDEENDCGTISSPMTKAEIGKPIRVLCKYYNLQ